MIDVEDYDLVVLGSGEAGKYIAWSVASQGKRAAVIERRYIGGSCPNIACLPSKNVIYSAKVASLVRRSSEFGIELGESTINMTEVRARKRKMVEGLVEMHQNKFKASGAELVLGSGTFVAPRTIEVKLHGGGTRQLRGENVVISTGTRAKIDDTPGLAESQPMTHIEALELAEIPPHLIVLGGGYIGLELAQAMRRLRSCVTVIDRNKSVIHKEDNDVTQAVTEVLREEGIDVLTSTELIRVEGTSGSSVRLHLKRDGAETVIEGTHLLAAAGRVPNTDGIGLETVGVERDERGHVKVNEKLQTTAHGVWAVGDCAGSPYFTHIAFDDYRIVRDNLAGKQRVTTGRQVPFCLFTDPELARIGPTEKEAIERGQSFRKLRIPMEAALRSRTISETRGFMKALISPDDRILSFTMFGAEAGEIMAIVQLAMTANLPYTTLRDSIITHPTMAEGLVALFSALPTQ